MFKVNDKVLYLNQGVCRIDEITNMKFGKDTKKYYVLKPIFQKESVVYVPTDNEKLTSKMKTVMSQDEAIELIKVIPNQETIWIDDENERHERYRTILAGGDRKKLVRLIKTLHTHQQEQEQKGKKLHQGDERIFKDAEKLLHDEFALVLNIKPDDVPKFIENQIKAI